MEKWRDIPGYEGLYQASNLGQIRTCEGKITQNARCSKRVWKQRILKQKVQERKNGRKDARVSLWRDGVCKTCLVARLVAMAWVDGWGEKMTVNHIDGNPMNNACTNLEWLPLGDNIRHGFSHGLYTAQKPVALANETGVVKFGSNAEASRFLGRSTGYLSNQIKRGKFEASCASGGKYTVVI